MAAYFSARRRTSFSGRTLRSSVTWPDQRFAEGLPGGIGVEVGSAHRFVDDLVDQFEAEQVLGGELESIGGALTLAGVLPEDRGAAPQGR